MLRFSVLALSCAALLSACTEYARPTPPQHMFDPHFSDSVGYTGVGNEPFSSGFQHPG